MEAIIFKKHVCGEFYEIQYLCDTFQVTERQVHGEKVLYLNIIKYLGDRRHTDITRSHQYKELIAYTNSILGDNEAYFFTKKPEVQGYYYAEHCVAGILGILSPKMSVIISRVLMHYYKKNQEEFEKTVFEQKEEITRLQEKTKIL